MRRWIAPFLVLASLAGPAAAQEKSVRVSAGYAFLKYLEEDTGSTPLGFYEGESNTSWGGMTGLGVDVPLGSSVFLRLGADFQIFFEDGENLKTLRLNAGLSF